MIITAITPHVYEYDLPNPISDARNTITKRSCLLVEVETDEGLVGWGEAASFANCGKLVADVIRFLEPRFVGQDPRFISRLYDTQYHLTQHFGRRGLVINALSGIDVALWDLQGKRAGLPVYQLLGASRDKIAFYFNSGYFVEGDHHGFLEQTVEQSVERGAGAIKIKIGRHGFADDVWRVERAREILGPERDLMVDANACLPTRYLQRLDDVLFEHGVRWLEEPIPLQNRSVLIELRNRLRTPIAGYELEMTLPGYHQLLKDRVIDIVQPDAIWSGGITECHRIAAVAQAESIEFVPHNFASIVGLAANAHLAASAHTGGWLEVDSNDNPFLWPVDTHGAYELEDGHIPLPDVPGLGVEPNLEALEALRVDA